LIDEKDQIIEELESENDELDKEVNLLVLEN